MDHRSDGLLPPGGPSGSLPLHGASAEFCIPTSLAPESVSHLLYIRRSIDEIKYLQEEQKWLLHSQLQALLQPLQESVQIMQSQLRELSYAPLVTTKGHGLDRPTNEGHPGSTQCGSKSEPPPIVQEKRSGLDSLADDFHLESTACGSKSQPDDIEDKRPGDLEAITVFVADDTASVPRVDSSSKFYDADGKPQSQTRPSSALKFDMVEQRKIQLELKEAAAAEGQSESRSNVSDALILKIDAVLHYWSSMEIPTYDNCATRLVNSNFFQPLCMFAIFSNSILVAASADWKIHHIGQGEPQILSRLQFSFAVFFLIELIVRLAAYRIYYFINEEALWNMFDFVLVAISAFDFIFEQMVGSAEGGQNISFLRVLRLLKMARIFRALRTFQFFKALGVMLAAFTRAFLSLFWGLVLLSFLLYLFSLIYLQALVDYLNYDADVDAATMELVKTRFGSLPDVIVSMYMCVTGGRSWGTDYDLMAKVGPVYAFLFLLFTFFFFFGLFNVLTALVVEKAMVEGKPDRMDRILQQRRLRQENKAELLEICQSIDANHDGKISFREFSKWINHSVVHRLMETLGLHIGDINLFFAVVGARDKGEVPIGKFVEGCLHMKGSATALDMQKQLYEMDYLMNRFALFDITVSERLSSIEKAINSSARSESHVRQL